MLDVRENTIILPSYCMKECNVIFRHLKSLWSYFASLCANANVNKSFPSVGAQTRHTRHGMDTSFRFRIRKTARGSRIQISGGYAIFMSMKCRCSVTQVGSRPNHAPASRSVRRSVGWSSLQSYSYAYTKLEFRTRPSHCFEKLSR